MKVSWPQVALLCIYVFGAIGALLVGTSAADPIAYMLAGAAANTGMMGAIHHGPASGRPERNTLPPDYK